MKLACIEIDGNRCKASTFSQRKKLRNVVTKEKYKEIEERISELRRFKLIPDYNEVADIDNGEIYEWYSVGDGPYGRVMYCLKTNTVRHQTMGEFYENRAVD